MRLVERLMPGNLVSSVFVTGLCLGSCALTLLARPTNLVPLFILGAASFGTHAAVLVMLGVQQHRQRRAMNKNGDYRACGVHQAGNQLGLTATQSVIWLAIVAVYILDLAHSLSAPDHLICPSSACALYGIAISLAYVILFAHIAQLLGFALIIYEVQTAPQRVLADRTLSAILKKSIPQLVGIREEARRVRDMGRNRPDRAASRVEEGGYTETTGALRRAERSLSNAELPGMTSIGMQEQKGGRRRMRTTSAHLATAAVPLHTRRITLDEVQPIVMGMKPAPTPIPRSDSRAGQSGLQMRILDRRLKAQQDGRYPIPAPIHIDKKPGFTVDDDPFIGEEAMEHMETLRGPHPIGDSPPTAYHALTRQSVMSAGLYSPAVAESAVLPFDPSMVPKGKVGVPRQSISNALEAGPFSPESTYSRWSADVTPVRRSRASSMDTVTPRGIRGIDADSPRDDCVVTPV